MSAYHHFAGMNWPLLGERLDGIEWQLCHGEVAPDDKLILANVIAAYRSLILGSAARRESVCRELRKAMKVER